MTDQPLATAPPSAPFNVGIPTIYCNGFGLNLTNTDVSMVLMLDNQPVFNLHVSFTTAKTLSIGLGQAIAQLEKLADREIMTSTYIAESVGRQATSEPKSTP